MIYLSYLVPLPIYLRYLVLTLLDLTKVVGLGIKISLPIVILLLALEKILILSLSQQNIKLVSYLYIRLILLNRLALISR